MNKGLMLALFGVLLGSTFAAITNVTDTVEGVTGKYTYNLGTANTTTEGGNVTEVNLSSNSSTEKWAGFYGNVSGNLLLAQSYTTPAMYVWTWAPASGGEVCASTGADFGWSAVQTTTRNLIDAAWYFATGDSDSATSTLTDGSATYDVNGVTGATTGTYTNDNSGAAVWQTFALDDTGTAKGDFAFCVNMSTTNTFAPNGNTGAYQLMVPTNETVNTFETYFFFVELN